MAVNLPKIIETPYFSLHYNSTKQNGSVTMTFPVTLNLWCFRTTTLLMVILNIKSQKSMGRVYPENCSKNAKALGSGRVKEFVELIVKCRK